MTRVFFDTTNFADYSMLEHLHKSMNNACSRDVDDSQVFTALSPRRLVMGLRHNVLGLFKLLFLEAPPPSRNRNANANHDDPLMRRLNLGRSSW